MVKIEKKTEQNYSEMKSTKMAILNKVIFQPLFMYVLYAKNFYFFPLY